MVAKILKIFLWLIFTGFVIIQAVLLYYGIATILTTISLYALLLLTGIKVINRKNVRLSYITLIVGLFIGEVILCYGMSPHETGTFDYATGLYVSPFREAALENMGRQLMFKQQNRWLKIWEPNTTRTIANSEFSYQHRYNSLGLREREIPKDTSIYKIVGLGDSFTEGVGTHQDSTWLRFLEYSLNKALGTNKVVTINGGSEGSDPIDEYMTLKELLLPYKPDLVIVAINETDLNDIIIRGGFERFLPNHTKTYHNGKWWEPLYATSHLFRHTLLLFKDLDFTLLTPDERKKAMNEAQNILIKTIRKFKTLSREHGFRLLCVFHPLGGEDVQRSNELDFVYDQIAEDSSILSLNLLKTFRNPPNSDIYYWKKDGHHTKAGYQLWGETVANFLIDRKVGQTIFPVSDEIVGQQCYPAIDTLKKYMPDFPINAPPPKVHTVASALKEIQDKQKQKGWTLQHNPAKVLGLYTSWTFAFLPKNKANGLENLDTTWEHLSLPEMVQIANSQVYGTACGQSTDFLISLIHEGLGDSVKTTYFYCGDTTDESKGHTVALAEYNDTVYYLDALRNVMVIDFFKAFDQTVKNNYGHFITLKEYFGPDYSITNPQEIARLAYKFGLDSIKAYFENRHYSVPFDSMFFCSRVPDAALGIYQGNGHDTFINSDPWSESSAMQILNSVESFGYDRKIENSWRIHFQTGNPEYQSLLDSLYPQSKEPFDNSGLGHNVKERFIKMTSEDALKIITGGNTKTWKIESPDNCTEKLRLTVNISNQFSTQYIGEVPPICQAENQGTWEYDPENGQLIITNEAGSKILTFTELSPNKMSLVFKKNGYVINKVTYVPALD